jgi:threonine/homoserine/homoserine lactone efflux protein
MFSASALWVFVLAALGLLLVPGPAVLYIIGRSVGQGRRAGLASVFGIELGSLVHATAAALGLSAILVTSALVFNVVKYFGAAYLIYLGLRTILAKNGAAEERDERPRGIKELFAKGFLVNLLNPKTALFFYAFLPQFVDPSSGTSSVRQILVLSALFIAMASCTDSLYALAGSFVGRLFLTRPGLRKAQKYTTGGICIALGIAAAVTGHGKE